MSCVHHHERNWMAWHNGVDAILMTQANLPQANIIIHVSPMVNTPYGMAASGLVLFNPDLKEMPDLFGFVTDNEAIGAYFGPHIFVGTPFEKAPVLKAEFNFTLKFPEFVKTQVKVGALNLEMTLSEFSEVRYYERPAEGLPFIQNVEEAKAHKAELKVNGVELPVVISPAGIGPGLPAVWAPTGIYRMP